MTWTYDGDPAATSRDEVRWLVGDTDTSDQLVTDEEIAYALATYGTAQAAAAATCEAIAAKFARQADRAVGDLRISASQKAKAYAERAQKIQRQGSLLFAAPYAGGISEADKEAVEGDSDRVAPTFSAGMMQNEEA